MRSTELFEAIDTAAIDRAARKSLSRHLHAFMEGEWEHLVSIYGDDHEDRSEIYDEWYQRTSRETNSSKLFVQSVCDHATRALNEVVQAALAKEFPTGRITIKGQGGFDYTLSPSDITVKIEAREHSEDAHKHYGGYFQGHGAPKIRCFVQEHDVQVAAWGTMQEIAFGEGEDADLLTKLIGPIFVHEFTHLLQFLRGGSATDNDFGYIEVHGGKRGGRRDPTNKYGTTPDPRSASLRYRSSAKEIESFAAEAASTIVADIESRYRYRQDHSAEDAEIRHVLRDIAAGYDSDATTSDYRQITWRAMEGAFTDLGVPDHQIAKMWKRYLKLVYRKLWTYSQGRMGKAEMSRWNEKYPKDWIAAARKGISFASAYIANQVAMEVDGNKRYDLQSNGSTFLERYFFGEEYGYDFEQSMKVTRAFNRLVDKAIDRQNSFGA